MLLFPESHVKRSLFVACFTFMIVFLSGALQPYAAEDNGLLFYLSGENGLNADYANGDPAPNYVNNIESAADGAKGNGIQCNDSQLLAYEAPGNVYAQRGTLSFFWRGRTSIGETPFPIFRVGYADHSSWDLVWLRLDWNGSGFEGFITDINLARPRLVHTVSPPPAADKWVHLSMSWDETVGMRLYVDGHMVAKHDTTVVLDAGLDQFGPHSRIISPYQVQSLYNYIRGGDIDELCFFDHMLDDGEIGKLAEKADPRTLATSAPSRSLENAVYHDEWLLRYGWNRRGDMPPYLAARSTRIKKVEIHDVYDVKQWVWKGTDGIRETTWPYVYNMSRIPGREDYFMIPDWNCYSMSGKKVTFSIPDEPFNHLEISGAASGSISLLGFDKASAEPKSTWIDHRPVNQERTFHRMNGSHIGGKIQFTNDHIEAPIGEFSVYNVETGPEPVGKTTLSYRLSASAALDNVTLDDLKAFIAGRYLPEESQTMVALPSSAPRNPKTTTVDNPLPIVHALIPCEFRKGKQNGRYTRFSYTWENMYHGLDGIAIDIPALDLLPLREGLIPLNIRIMDPVWPARMMFDINVSVRPGEARTVWLDTRDRILPNDKSLYLTISSALQDFGADDLDGAAIRLVFDDRMKAIAEQEVDRFTQVKDNLGNMVEEHPNQKKLRMYARYSEDMTELLRVNPDHFLGRIHWVRNNTEQGWPDFEQPKAPSGVPLWAFRQVENLKQVNDILTWWIDERQIENGEFGGGLSDDGDMTNQFPGPALMGATPNKYRDSVYSLLDAFYDQGLFTNGLSTIATDELHTYEEGINVLPQAMLLDYGNPETVERILETAKAYESLTGINDRGQRQIKSIFYGGSKIYSEGVWAKSRPYSSLILHPGFSLVEYNGHPATKKLIVEVADGIIDQRKKDANGNYQTTAEIMFPSGEGIGRSIGSGLHVLWAAWRWTGDDKYLLPLKDASNRGSHSLLSQLCANAVDQVDNRKNWGPSIASGTKVTSGSAYNRHVAWQISGDKQYLEELYASQIQENTQRKFINTEAHWWIDRIYAQHRELQRARLGGIALWRNMLYPGNYVSWEFEAPATHESVAILIPNATPGEMKIIAYNLEKSPVTAVLTGCDVLSGRWNIVQGIDTDNDDIADKSIDKRREQFERTTQLTFTLPPRQATVITLKCGKKGKAYWSRPDLGISAKDIAVNNGAVTVTVHSIGSVKAPASSVMLMDATGAKIAEAAVTALEAPLDFEPKTATVTLQIPDGMRAAGLTVAIDSAEKIEEITERNNRIVIR